jgi:RsiW-degrading membrane proteinase PrsW (M82 family)
MVGGRYYASSVSFPVAATAALPTRRSRGRGRLISLITLTVVCVLGIGGVIFLAVRGSGAPEGAALSLGFALAPVPLVVGAFLWLDRYQPEPLRYLVAAFSWGAVVSVAIVLPLQLLAAFQLDVTDTALATFVAPLTEEPAKGAFLIVVLLRRRRELDGVVDGLVYAGLVGVGFSFTENVGYYAGAYGGGLAPELSGPEATTGLFIVRGLFSPFTHSLFAAAFGLGVGLAVLAHNRWVRWLGPVLGMLTAITLHGLWNGSVSYFGGGGFLLVYLLMMVPTFVAFVAIAALARRSEGRILVRALTDAGGRGWLHPAEVPYLASFPLRADARRFAKRVGGEGAARAVKAYQSAATRMAFQHDRVLRGRPTPDGIARVVDELDRMAAARPWVVLPPPLRLSAVAPAPRGSGVTRPPQQLPPGSAWQQGRFGSHPAGPQQRHGDDPPPPG